MFNYEHYLFRKFIRNFVNVLILLFLYYYYYYNIEITIEHIGSKY